MGGYLKRTLRFFALIVVAFFMLGLIGGIWPFLGAPFAAPLILLGVPAILLALLVGGVRWLRHGIRLASEEMRWPNRIFLIAWVPALCVAAFLSMGSVISLGSFSGALVRLTIHHQQYEAIIAKVRNERSRADTVEDGVGYFVFSGSPLNIQFAGRGEIHSLFGNIEFYDGEPVPAGDPRPGLRITGNRFFEAGEGCRHLSGKYYLCRLDL
ncbi:MAG: hypothetical protein KF730_08350 [Sphingomonas sp.]|uniref:hypothetical protein n=1 Tax=Sphingomonas sp. TaxID=28214 RepID=UPI0025E0AB41|nr:hypothetical protein [Sphingomonas sp.]MBX3564571.1 hypothetical protein [Sphingomonas sp.]